jgi:hypothetical protein
MAATSHADIGDDDYTLDLGTDVANQILIPRVLGTEPSGEARPKAATAGKSGAEAMAAGMPAARRAQALQVFTTLLTAYRQVEKRFGLRSNEPAGAVAAFVAGNLAAYRHAEISDAQFAALVKQLRTTIITQPTLVTALHADHGAAAEQLEIIGMLMLTSQLSLNQHPDAAAAKALERGAQRAVKQLLGVDLATISLDEQGMHVSAHSGKPTLGDQLAGGDVTNTASDDDDDDGDGDGDGGDRDAARRGERAAGPAAPASATTAADPDAASSVAVQAEKSIETVGFYTKVGYGVGGMMTFNPTPVVLFKSGEALYDMAALADPQGLDAHKKANPDEWTQWRKAGRSIELRKPKGWERLSFRTTMGRLPKSFRLDRTYQRLSGGGNVAVGGNVAIAAWSTLAFHRDGTFSGGGGAGASAPGVATSSRSAERGGTYAVAGYRLTLRYGDGTTVERMIVTDAKDPSVIWLDGAGYTSH